MHSYHQPRASTKQCRLAFGAWHEGSELSPEHLNLLWMTVEGWCFSAKVCWRRIVVPTQHYFEIFVLQPGIRSSRGTTGNLRAVVSSKVATSWFAPAAIKERIPLGVEVHRSRQSTEQFGRVWFCVLGESYWSLVVILNSYSKIAKSSSRISLGRFWRLCTGQRSATFCSARSISGKREFSGKV